MMTQLRSRSLGAAILAGVSCSATPTHAADLVLQWNEIGQHAVAPANAYIQSRSMAIMHLAILDAVTGATSTVGVGNGAATPPFSPDAAAISAAHDVIRTLHPESAASVEPALTAGLASILDGELKVQGISRGRIAAAKMLERRKDDGWNATGSYAPGSGPGIWVATPPAHAPALLPHWGKVTFRYASFKAIADQIDDARVYGGIHIREDQEVGGELGRKVGRFVYETLSQGRR